MSKNRPNQERETRSIHLQLLVIKKAPQAITIMITITITKSGCQMEEGPGARLRLRSLAMNAMQLVYCVTRKNIAVPVAVAVYGFDALATSVQGPVTDGADSSVEPAAAGAHEIDSSVPLRAIWSSTSLD